MNFEGIYILEIRELMREMDIVLEHIPRTQNGDADRLAKRERDQLEDFKETGFQNGDCIACILSFSLVVSSNLLCCIVL